VIVEKPFGRDSASSAELGRGLAQHLAEDEIYRIDHYLGEAPGFEIAGWSSQLPDMAKMRALRIVCAQKSQSSAGKGCASPGALFLPL
jgi:hypothetical protein